MFQPLHDRLPSQYDLMPPTLWAIHQMVGGSRNGVHFSHIDERIVDYLRQRIPADDLNQTTRTGSKPLIIVRLGSARSLLKKEDLLRNSGTPQGCWALTPKALRLIRNRRLGDGGTGNAPPPPANPTRPSPRSSGSRSRSLAIPQSKGLVRASARVDMDPWIDALVASSRKFTVDEAILPDGTVLRRIDVR